MGQTWSQVFPPTAKYHVEDVPDLSGKVMIVTGGNSGIGKEIVRALLVHNAKVYLAARSSDKAEAAIDELRKDTGKEAIFLKLDLASLASVRHAAKEFLEKEKQLDALFNNAGIMFLNNAPHALDLTEDGYDIQWGTNVVGPFHLTNQLLPALIEGAKQSADKKARITFVSSISETKAINWDTLTDTPARKKLGPDKRYGQSKYANTVMAQEFARKYGDEGLVFASLDPGGIKTELQRAMPGLMRSLLSPLLHPPVMGALTHLRAATSPESVDFNGKFFIPFARIGVPPASAQDPGLGKRVFELLDEQTKKA